MFDIYHYAGGGRNWGDLALIYGMQCGLQNAARGRPLRFINLDLKQAIPIADDTVKLINQGDMLLVGGGGLVMRGDGFSTDSGWQFNISLPNLADIEVPIVVYGIGYNNFPYEDPLSDQVWEHLRIVQNRAALFSVRDQGTKQVLMQHGLKDMDVIPDPATSLPTVDTGLFLGDCSLAVGVNWAGDRQGLRSKGTMEDDIRAFCSLLSGFLETVEGSKAFFIPHVNYDILAYEYFKKCMPGKIENIIDIMPELWPESFARVPLFADVYSKMDLVIGMRGHSLIIPFGQGTPIVGYGQHTKLDFFAAETGAQVIHHAEHSQGYFNSVLQRSMSERRGNDGVRIWAEANEALVAFNRRVVGVLTG
jgi:hypothetical protein|tara:strand:+ start:34672 stop:35760 length:1089 start_codon:yes stop_codon:yes gene_type:complete